MNDESKAHARNTDPATSHEAAESVSPKIRASQEAVWRVLSKSGPCHDTDLVKYYDASDEPLQSPSGIRTRRKELVTLGKARWTGEKVLLPTGRRADIYEAIEKDWISSKLQGCLSRQ